MKHTKVIAVDFDGTICENAYPKIGAPKMHVVNKMREWHEAGHTIIIWTCRQGQTAKEAEEFLVYNDIPYDYFNENPTTSWGDDSRKIVAHVYVDDRALNVDDIDLFDIETESLVDVIMVKDMKFITDLLNEIDRVWDEEVDKEIDEIRGRYGL